jgi:hypothetical protein
VIDPRESGAAISIAQDLYSGIENAVIQAAARVN